MLHFGLVIDLFALPNAIAITRVKKNDVKEGLIRLRLSVGHFGRCLVQVHCVVLNPSVYLVAFSNPYITRICVPID